MRTLAAVAMIAIGIICLASACQSAPGPAGPQPGPTATVIGAARTGASGSPVGVEMSRSPQPSPFGQSVPTSIPEPSPAATLSPGSTLANTAVPTPTMAVEFVVRPDISPMPVAERIVGGPTDIQRAPESGRVPNPEQQDRLRRTWLVPIPPGGEQAALARAQQDPDVENASLVRWPPLVAHPQ